MNEKRLPRIVVIGGGTGMPVLLRGLKDMPIHLTVLVTVADDGGSTGRLREEIEIPAPGDIRNVIAALSDVEPVLLELFQHRFNVENGLSGHSLGNMLLAAMTSITGDFYEGIEKISKIFNVKGTIYPILNESVSLKAEMEDGTIIKGESNIPLKNKKIKRVSLEPSDVTPLPHTLAAIHEADMVVISPGSLYTSILPNLIVPEITKAIKQTDAKVIYICNLMTQPGETSNYTAADHIQALYDHIGTNTIDAIVVHNEPIKASMRQRYAAENAKPVVYDTKRLQALGLTVIEKEIIDLSQAVIRHDTKKVAKLIYELAKEK